MKLLLLFFVVSGIALSILSNEKSDEYIRNRVLMLHGVIGLCSAVEVKAPSGKVYTMSAAHCEFLAVNGSITAENEKGDFKKLKVLKIDSEHDLMLLEAFDDKSIDIAKNIKIHDHIYTMTHGHGMPSYRTDGELLQEDKITIPSPIEDDNSLRKCQSLPGHTLAVNESGLVCLFKYFIVYGTADVLPGSSGGPLMDSSGNLVGIVSATDGYFSAFVPLHFIHDFIRGM